MSSNGITAYPLDNTEYEAFGLGLWLATRERGVYSSDTGLQITTNGDMSVTVSPGLAWLKMSEFWGVSVLIQEGQTRIAEQADGSLERFDIACLRLNKTLNTPELVIKTGDYVANPGVDTLPLPTRDLNFDELYLGALRIRAGATEITDSDICPLHLNETYCGIMRDGVTGIPTQALYAQWMAWFTEHQTDAKQFMDAHKQMVIDLYMQYQAEIGTRGDNADAAFDGFIDRITAHETAFIASLNDYMDTIRGILGADEAANLLLMIQELQKRVPTATLGTVSTLAATPQLYPLCALYKSAWGFGMGGAGVGPAGGTAVVAIDAGFEYDGEHNVTVTAPAELQDFTIVHQLSDATFAFLSDVRTETAGLVLRILKEAS